MNRAERIYCKDITGSNKKIFASLVSSVNNESLIIYPTETIYGIGGITTHEVEKKIYSIKKRKNENPLILIASNIEKFSYLHLKFTPESEKLASAFWPGRLTIILSSRNSEFTFGIRVSDHPFLQLISDYVNLPLYSTSANISGENYLGDPDTIYNLFKEKIDIMVDYGKLPESLPSTVVDATENRDLRVVREGSITKKMIFNTLSQ